MATPSEQAKDKTDLSGDRNEGSEVVGDLFTNLQDVKVGIKLEAKDVYGKWYMARVVEVEQDKGEVLVHFERWNSRYDENIKISSKRLRILPPDRMAMLQKERDRRYRKKLDVGDLVQARWEDGRMYFGQVQHLYEDEVDVLFDDGVKYKAPMSAVRKRNHSSRSNLSKSSLYESDGSQTRNSRSLRAQKRHRSEDDTSQTSYSSPPSSPVFMPSKRQRISDSDSSYSDSDFDGGSGPRSSDEVRRKVLQRRGLGKRITISASSDSETSLGSTPTRKKKRFIIEHREAYKLRKPTPMLSTVKEHSEINKASIVGKLLPKEEPPEAIHSPSPAASVTASMEGTKDVKAVAKNTKKGPAMALRPRAQAKLENVSVRKAEPRKSVKMAPKEMPLKVAPKEMVIVLDHNEFKCKITGCNKSFRKDSLLQSHIKHYHSSYYKSVMKQKPSGHSAAGDKRVKMEASESPKVPALTDKAKSPPLESPRTPSVPKISPRSANPKKKDNDSSNRKQQKTADCADDSEATVPDGNHRDHPSAQLETTPTNAVSTPKQTPKTSKKSSGLSVAGHPLKIPLVEIKPLSRDVFTSPKKSLKSNSLSKSDVDPTGKVCVVGGVVSVGGVLNEANDVVHCVCGDMTDEGFMIQCEECLCWQHGDCVRVTKATLADRYVCCYCTNPPGLRNRLRYQFDKEWFSVGSLPSLSGAPQFPHTSTIKHTHQLTDTLYQLRKILHSAKVKLQAVSRVNHPYMRQWAKECTHVEKKELISYLIKSLVPISYTPEQKEASNEQPPTNGETKDDQSSGNGFQNGDNDSHSHDRDEFDVASLQLDPLPQAISQSSLNGAAGKTAADSPDPKTLKLAPLPPLKTESLQQLTTDILKKSIELSVVNSNKAASGANPSNSRQADGKTSKAQAHEVVNNEFGVQELSVFALSSSQTPPPSTSTQSLTPSPSKLVSISRPTIVTPSALGVTTLYSNSTPLTAGPPQTLTPKSLLLGSSTPKLTSTMDSVSLEEFADAFVQGDTTNWYQRMKLLDHIESVQEKAYTCMESLESQLEELPPDAEGLEGIEQLLGQVQTTMSQLRQIQVANQA